MTVFRDIAGITEKKTDAVVNRSISFTAHRRFVALNWRAGVGYMLPCRLSQGASDFADGVEYKNQIKRAVEA